MKKNYTKDSHEVFKSKLNTCLSMLVGDTTKFELDIIKSASIIIVFVKSTDKDVLKVLIGRKGSAASAVRTLCTSYLSDYNMKFEYTVCTIR